VTTRMNAALALCAVAMLTLYLSACNDGNAAPQPENGDQTSTQDDPNGNGPALINDDSDAPKGKLTDDGLVFTVPFERGDGTITLARQNGLLRVDTVVMMPYHGGDLQRDEGASVRLAFSVNGVAGRMLFYLPSPLWAPNQQGQLAAFRMEASYNRTEGVRRLAERPAFVGKADLAHYDRWKSTMYVDMRRMIMPGNTPDSRADSWRFGAVLGSSAGMVAWPEGLEAGNPGQSPQHMVTFKFSELPELDDLDDDPRDALIAREEAMHEAMRRVSALPFSLEGAPRLFEELKRTRDQFPEHLWPRDLLYQISRASAQNGIQGVDHDYVKYLGEYISVAPGQSRAHTDYLHALLRADREKDAREHFAHVMSTPLVTGRKATEGFMKLEWAQALSQWGFISDAEALLTEVAEHPGIQQDDYMRVTWRLAQAALEARRGDSAKAAEMYQKVMTDERSSMTPQQLQGIQQYHQFQLQAAEQWEDELKYRAEDAEKTNPRWIIETSKGRVIIELFEDDAPNTVKSLVKLARDGFYNGLNFHRVEPDFMAQGGCPQGNGMGNPGYSIKREISRRNHFRGTLAMARSQHPDSAGSQFYICFGNGPSVLNLSGEYAVVGRVIEGMDVVDMIRVGTKIESIRVENLRDHEYEPETLPVR